MAKDKYPDLPIVVTFKTSNRSNAKTKQKVIRNRNVDEVNDINTKIPGIPECAVILSIAIGERFMGNFG
jgi:hypothetical protein